ncbi:3-deoxy-D-manno-octulosonic acid transferase [Abyssalbus ytuae]|uniref:3-deoxy-D-manno-octulosonic acid transferase n=1 Tax=Abyssalbus ytuae TaxID=2926907 RepID=A0A9E6ZNC9_9FLAO|nr:glycosyltransferase N-terminal domain-containing protein [Abyssalbus ytuae]UOB19052.1 3-deoxy-D-manno-octulosonic acid transferase [Abyssalbus ytuae]
MIFLYNILINIISFFLKIVAAFNDKIKLFVEGRREVFQYLKKNIGSSDKIIWFHTASLGEFEQGLPVIEDTKAQFPDHKILVTFFSPSGYEVKKNSKAAHYICYLPLDTKKNAKKFLETVNPKLAIFVKYEFWPNYLAQLKKRNINTLLISGIFRKEQIFFKPLGGFMRISLKTFNHFFVQDENSQKLLNDIGLKNVTVSGDTRFDRVTEILEKDNTLDFIENFKQNKLCFVAGSTWPEDESLIVNFINDYPHNDCKFIIAPHNIKPAHITDLKLSLNKKTLLFSQKKDSPLSDFDVFIVDTIGILTKIYSYADIAYVGGGMGSTGLHNTLEPAVYGVPVIIGKNYSTFKEARDLINLGGILSISSQEIFNKNLLELLKNSHLRHKLGDINQQYINKNKGAKIQIGYQIRKLL